MTDRDPRSLLPGVDVLLSSAAGRSLVERHGPTRATTALRAAVEEARSRVHADTPPAEVPTAGEVTEAAASALRIEIRTGLRPVLNATGVVLHTNLGRAPIAPPAAAEMLAAAQGYSNLEFDLDEGVRGSRYDHCVDEILALTGAEDALVVNNCAGGLLLAMQALAGGGRAVVSRGELVEIGGGFRIPEVLQSAGTRLAEVGSTNRTRIEDYRAEIEGEGAEVLLKVHRSNFRISGFTAETTLEELVQLARDAGGAAGTWVVHDLGSGLILPPERLGLPPEPRPRESISAGADLVIFSGDKLLGGPQAGIVAGRSEVVARLRRAPLCRALRVDKVTLAGLRGTLRLLADPNRAVQQIPALRYLAATASELRERAEAIVAALPADSEAAAVDTEARVGGGTYPETPIPSVAVSVAARDGVAALAKRLRLGDPAIVARAEGDRLVLDLRAIDPDRDGVLAEALRGALEPG